MYRKDDILWQRRLNLKIQVRMGIGNIRRREGQRFWCLHKQKSFPPYPDRRAASNMGKETDRLEGSKTCRQVGRQADWRAGRQAGGHEGRWAGRGAGRWAGIAPSLACRAAS